MQKENGPYTALYSQEFILLTKQHVSVNSHAEKNVDLGWKVIFIFHILVLFIYVLQSLQSRFLGSHFLIFSLKTVSDEACLISYVPSIGPIHLMVSMPMFTVTAFGRTKSSFPQDLRINNSSFIASGHNPCLTWYISTMVFLGYHKVVSTRILMK